MDIGLIGAGSWGTALAILLGRKGLPITLWVRRASLLEEITRTRLNSIYLPDVYIPDNIVLTNDLEKTVRRKNFIIMSVPSHALAGLVHEIKDFLDERAIIVNTAKGLAEGPGMRLSQVIDKLVPRNRVAVLSGPNHAEEVSRLLPTASVVASTEQAVAEKVQDIFMAPTFRVYTNPDIVGVELGGALKNIIAIGAGVCDGLDYGDNTKAALLTRGLVEITRLGLALGAQKGTFSGLTGMGDLFVTCTSRYSRNRYVGMMLGKNQSLKEISSTMKMVAEGIRTTRIAYELSQSYDIKMPITKEIYELLFLGKDSREAVKNLMQRQKTHEIEEIAFD